MSKINESKTKIKEIFILSSEKINDRYVANKIPRRNPRIVNYSEGRLSHKKGR